MARRGRDQHDGAADRDRPTLVVVQEIAAHEAVQSLRDLAKVLAAGVERPVSDGTIRAALNEDIPVDESEVERVKTLVILTACFDELRSDDENDGEEGDVDE